MEKLEVARPEELEVCYAMVDMGRAFQREQGFIQWTEDYPNRETIRQDIQNQTGYVLRIEEKIVGYLCVDFDGEPAYNNILGKWNTGEPYAVVHRMAFDKTARNRGISTTAFRLIEQLCRDKGIHSIRVDTDFPNKRMQYILEKNGFSKCGTVFFQGGGKLAYDKVL